MRIYLVDDHAFIRERMKSLLADISGVDIVGEADNEADGIDGVRVLQPDLLIVDLELGPGSGLKVMQAAVRDAPGTRIIVLSGFLDAFHYPRLIRAGATLCLDKATEFDRVRDWVVQAIGAGRP